MFLHLGHLLWFVFTFKTHIYATVLHKNKDWTGWTSNIIKILNFDFYLFLKETVA